MIKKWLSFSTSLHLGLAGALLFFRPRKLILTPQKIFPISEHELAKKEHGPQIVTTNSTIKTNKKVKSKRLAKENQETEKETVAKPSEDTIPGNGEFGSAPKSITTQGKGAPAKQGKGVSASDDLIEGVEIGPMTILNAQEFKYVSYYERIKQSVVETWRPLIKKAIRKVKSDPKRYGELTVGYKTTKLEITLNEKGEVLSLRVVSSSGFKLFDDCGDRAFRSSAPYAAPPKELVKNGVFTIRWDFSVAVEEAGLVKYNTGSVK